MKKFILLLLVGLIFLSGCTIPPFPDDSGVEPTKPLSISLSSDQSNVNSRDITYMYLTFDNLDENEEYGISAKIMNPGLFDISGSFENIKLSKLQKKNLEFELKARKVSAETPTTVSVETTVSKDFEFYLPILFADSGYLKQQEVAGKPVQKRPKTYSFSDNLVNVDIELNKEPPVTTGTTYANVKVYPKGSGRLDSLGLSAKGGSCEMNKLQSSASCSFSGSARTLEEKKFEVSVNYDYKETKSLRFTILPEVVVVIPPKAEISLLEKYCFLNYSSVDNICNFELVPIKQCDGINKINCIKSVEKLAEIEGDLGESAFATLEDKGKYLKIYNIDKGTLENIIYPRIHVNYTYIDGEGEEKELDSSVIPIIVLYDKEKKVIEKNFPEDFKDEVLFLNDGFFNIKGTEEQLRVTSICGTPKELSANIGNHSSKEENIMIWYRKAPDTERYVVDYYENERYKETIAKETNPKDLEGKTYLGTEGGLKILNASEDKITVKAVSGSSRGFPLSTDSHSKSCDYSIVYEKKDNKYILTIAKLKE